MKTRADQAEIAATQMCVRPAQSDATLKQSFVFFRRGCNGITPVMIDVDNFKNVTTILAN
jgi:hypothetical protein